MTAAPANPQAPPSPAEQERIAIWARVAKDYREAHGLARVIWPKDTPADVLQAATATILIHHHKLQELAVQARSRAKGQAADASEPQGPAPTECPKCQGPIYDNRGPSRGKRPYFKCKDAECGWAKWPPKQKASA